MLLPAGGLLEKLACRIVPDDPQTQGEKTTELDERLLPTPSLALRQSRTVAREGGLRRARAEQRSHRP